MPKKAVTKEIDSTKQLLPKNPAKSTLSKNSPKISLKKTIKKKEPIKRDIKSIPRGIQIPERHIEEGQTEKILVENFVSLQKVMTNLALKFDDLSNQISKLLELFEISAKSISGKEFDTEKIDSKLNQVLEQNKTIAKGISLMHETNSEPVHKETPEKTHHRKFKPWPK